LQFATLRGSMHGNLAELLLIFEPYDMLCI
jgi:hypothetical protein